MVNTQVQLTMYTNYNIHSEHIKVQVVNYIQFYLQREKLPNWFGTCSTSVILATILFLSN